MLHLEFRITALSLILAPLTVLAVSGCGLGGDESVGNDGDNLGNSGSGTGGDGSGGGSASGGANASGGSASGGDPGAGGASGPSCGNTTCAVGETCCNESCGICTGPNDSCIELYCGDPPPCAVEGLCAAGFTWDGATCACVGGCDPNVIPSCPSGSSWDVNTCRCESAGCDLAALSCPVNTTPDPSTCSCLPPTTGVACGNTICGPGLECCEPTCGTCAPPGVACIQIACLPPGSCTQDSDCTLAEDYCTGCDCRVLAPGESLPPCPGPGVSCFAPACLNRTAACEGGVCRVR